MSMPVEDIVGYKVGTLGPAACVADVVTWVKAPRYAGMPGHGRWLGCMNPHSYAVALQDAQFSNALRAANWLIPDGAGVVLASRLMGGQVRERVTGSDVFFGVMKALNEAGGASVFFLGSTEETLGAIRERVAVDYPNVRLVGTYSPPFKPVYLQDELDAMAAAINVAAPDVLWVGMTAPKQEKWIHAEIPRLNIKFAAAIGAVFDFYTGRVKRSPPVFQRLGLEWLPRLVQEPRRLWRRMFVSAPVFLFSVLRFRLTRRPVASRSGRL